MDEAAHLGVPAARLVAEVDAGLQQLLDPDFLGHGCFSLDRCGDAVPGRRGGAGPGASGAGQGPRPRWVGVARGRRQDTAAPVGARRTECRRDGASSGRRLRCSLRGPALPSPTSGGPARLSLRHPRQRSAAARSAGSGERTSTGSPVTGCGKASRAACRNWRSRPWRPGRAVVAGRRRPDGRSPAGARGSGACGRSRAARAAACRRAAPRSTSKWVIASRGSSVSVEIRVRTRRSRPSGASMVPRRAGGRPSTSARYSRRDRARLQRGLERARAPARSGRRRAGRTCRGPAGARCPARVRVVAARHAAGERLRERAAAVPARRVDDHARRACRPPAGARPRRRRRTRAGGDVGLGVGRRRSSTRDHARRRAARGAWAAARRRRARARRRSAAGPPAREPAWLGEEDVEPLARGLGRDDELTPSGGSSVALAPRPLEDETSASTPNVIAMSATLNAGKCGNLMKSVTRPWRARSIRLPSAPPSSSPVGSQTSGRPGVQDEEDEQREQRQRGDRPRAARRRPARKPNATPVLRTLTRSKPEDQVVRVAARDLVADERLRDLVERDDRQARRAGARSVARPGVTRLGSRSTTIPPTICSTRIATIGREVERADPQRQPPEEVAATGSDDVAQEVEHRVRPARVRARGRRSRRRTRSAIQAMITIDVDRDQRAEEVGDLARAAARRSRSPPRRPWPRANAARTPPRSSAASPRAVVPPGEATARRSASVSYLARAQQRRGAGHRLGDELAATSRRHAAADAGVDLRLDEQRPVGGPDAAGSAGDAHQRLGDLDDRADAPEAARAARACELRVDRRVGRGEGQHALARPRPACSAPRGRPATPG